MRDWHVLTQQEPEFEYDQRPVGLAYGRKGGRLFPVAIRIGSVADLKGEVFRIAEQLLLV